MKKAIIWVLFFVICFLSGALLSYHAPKVEAWLILLIERESSKSGVAGVLPTHLTVGLFPPRLKLEDVRVLPQGELRETLEPFTIQEIAVRPAVGALLRGNVRAAKLQVTGTHLLVRIPEGGSPQGQGVTPFSLSENFRQLPLDSLLLQDIDVTVTSRRGKIQAKAEGVQFESFVSWGQVHLVTSMDQVQIPSPAGDLIGGRVELQTEIFEDHILVKNMTLEQQGLSLSSEGPVHWPSSRNPDTTFDLNSELRIDGAEFTKYLKAQMVRAPFPPVRGQVTVLTNIKGGRSTPLIGSYELNTESLVVGPYTLGNVSSRGQWDSEKVRTDKVSIQHPAGRVEVDQVSWSWGEQESLSGEVNLEDLSLRRLLAGIGVQGVPVDVDVRGTLPCVGQVLSGFFLECQGHVRLFDLIVSGETSPIVEAQRLSAEGRVRVDKDKVQYDTQISVGQKSKGKSSGIIQFDEGFDLNFESPAFHFDDLKSLSGLKLEGVTSLKGRTWGDSLWGRVDLNAGASQLVFEDYELGEAHLKLSYRESDLSFAEISGRLRKTRYEGEVILNLRQGTLSGSLDLPYFEIQDLYHGFHKNLQIPVDLQGTGSGQVQFSGPLSLESLSYQLNADVYRGKIGPEYFDAAKVRIQSVEGVADFQNSTLSKGSSTISLSGQFKPFQFVNLEIAGEQAQLQDSSFLNSLTHEIMGRAQLLLRIQGPWEQIQTTLDANLQGVRIGGRSMGNSVLRGALDAEAATLTAELMDEALLIDLNYPMRAGLPFSLNMNAREWDFTRFLTGLRKELAGREFESAATFDLQLTSLDGNPWNFEGSFLAPRVRVRRGPSQLENPQPISIKFRPGQVDIESFELSGQDGSIVILGRPQSEVPLDIEIQSKLQLHFLSLFTPFLEDLQGTLSTSVNIKLGPKDFEMLGSAYIERGYFKSSDFPHPIEEVQADFLFNHRRILLNSARGILADGRVFASGEVEMRGLFDLPAALDIRVENVELEIPENFQTRGSGNLKISGNWFPFTLGGEYLIQSGRITDNFSGGNGATARRSRFLPPSLLLEQQTAPFQLDLFVRTEAPMEVNNDLLDGRVSAELRINGTADRPSLLGHADIVPPSTLLFRDHEFQVESAQIRFDGKPEVNPSLYITARTRLNEYDIQMLIQGTASRPEINLTSQPGLPEQEIITLLALGVPAQANADGLETSDMARQSTFQISALLFSDFGRQFKSQYNFDLQISPIFDEENNATAHRVTLGRQITPKLGAVASYEQGKSPKTDVKVKYQMNNQVFLVGSYENRPFTESVDVPETQDANIFGIDLEYRVDFK